MAHGDAREGKWKANWRMEWVASTLHTTSERGASSITTADSHTSAASSRLNWRPRRFKWTRPFRRKTKSGFCPCAITFQTQSTVSEYVFTLNTARSLTPALCPQTVDLTARLPAAESSNLKSATIRVLVVDPEGLVTIYSPVSPIQSVAPAVTLGSDVSSKVISKVMAGHRKKINTEVAPTTTKSPSAVSTPQYCGAIHAHHNLFVLHYG